MTYKTYTEDLADFGYREQEEAKIFFKLGEKAVYLLTFGTTE